MTTLPMPKRIPTTAGTAERMSTVTGSLGGVRDIYGGIKGKDPGKIGGGVLSTAGAIIGGPVGIGLAAGGALLGAVGLGKKKPSQNKPNTAMVKKEMNRMTLAMRRNNWTEAWDAFEKVNYYTLKSNSFRSALTAVNPKAWAQIGFIKEQTDKLNAGNLEGDPAGQLVNALTDFIADTKGADKVNPFIAQMRTAFGRMMTDISDQIQYTPYGRESYEQIKGDLTAMKGGIPPKWTADIEALRKWKPTVPPGEFSLPEGAERFGPYNIPKGEFSTGQTAFPETNRPPVSILPSEKPPPVPLTQQQYYEKSLGLGKYRGTPTYPRGYSPEMGQTTTPYVPPVAPAGIEVTREPEALGSPPPIASQMPEYPPQLQAATLPPPALPARTAGSRFDPATGKYLGPTPDQFAKMLAAIKQVRMGSQGPPGSLPPMPGGGRRPAPPMPGRSRPRKPGGPPPIMAYDPLTRLTKNLREMPRYG